MATQYTSAEWRTIRETLEPNRGKYGLPEREYGSVLLGSFNIRKLGSSRSRSPDTWEFLADVCRSFDLLAVQEVMDDLSGLRRLMSLLGPDFDLIVSDVTGRFPGESGLGERLGFIYRPSVVKRTEVATDITYGPYEGVEHDRGALRRVPRGDGPVRRQVAGPITSTRLRVANRG